MTPELHGKPSIKPSKDFGNIKNIGLTHHRANPLNMKDQVQEFT